MGKHANAELLIEWFRERASATVSEIVAAGLMKSCAADSAVQYALRYGALERVVFSGASVRDRVHYRVTGITLPASRAKAGQLSFDGLLIAWGIVLQPPRLRSTGWIKHEILDSE
jgi:hypothetical protein